MKRFWPYALLAVLVAGILGYLGWALWSLRGTGSWTGGSWVLGAIIVGGVLVTGALAGALMWLAFYSARRGYDDRPQDFDPWAKP
jgi:hypothetical protein